MKAFTEKWYNMKWFLFDLYGNCSRVFYSEIGDGFEIWDKNSIQIKTPQSYRWGVY